MATGDCLMMIFGYSTNQETFTLTVEIWSILAWVVLRGTGLFSPYQSTSYDCAKQKLMIRITVAMIWLDSWIFCTQTNLGTGQAGRRFYVWCFVCGCRPNMIWPTVEYWSGDTPGARKDWKYWFVHSISILYFAVQASYFCSYIVLLKGKWAHVLAHLSPFCGGWWWWRWVL